PRSFYGSIGAAFVESNAPAARNAPSEKATRVEEPAPTVQLSLMNQNKRAATPVGDIQRLLKEHFGFDSFRASQEAVCKSVIAGKDVLLVMPTGAGKSLCYQIPGIARGGTTLVISPLVALIEDQVAKLQSLKFSAERIHSGRSREESRQVCYKYLAGELDFLFIAPERLSVPGFPEFLKRQPPSLIAIDEAHCISQWGHDFRPDYRILGERLKDLRPVPVIALTATATPTVQNDICKQLGLGGDRIIQGFRRTNIAIEMAELPPGDRPGAIAAILARPGRLPAIVYSPTRKKTDELTATLSSNLRVGSYHAGMSASARDKVQSQFLENKLDVIVATVAFGMGIDKANIRTVIHAAMPGSVEGYYQEIGRAGRDGLPSQAYLLHSFADQKTHEFFFDLNYPDIETLQSIFDHLDSDKVPKDKVRRKLKIDSETFDRALEQLWVHRGVIVDPEENMSVGDPSWEPSYQLQRDLRQNQLRQMSKFTSSAQCRMIHLVSHFGDQNDSGKPCGNCDICKPDQVESLMKRRPLYLDEKETVERILLVLERDASGIASGRLFQALIDSNIRVSRGDFEKILKIMEQSGWIESHETSFEKDGKEINYRKIAIKQSAGTISQSDIETLEIVGFPTPASPGKRKKSPRRSKKRSRAGNTVPSNTGMSPRLFEPLRAWRLGQAREKKVPAFRILTDKALYAICEKAPQTLDELEEISIINRKALAQYGEEILHVVRTN
ncbi:MAG: ATP-dependent DNA helicase, partial [Bdellovibrionales bacterium]|nr:ATP-dependent DNA helicase [Bdellovibrionales bacterium]